MITNTKQMTIMWHKPTSQKKQQRCKTSTAQRTKKTRWKQGDNNKTPQWKHFFKETVTCFYHQIELYFTCMSVQTDSNQFICESRSNLKEDSQGWGITLTKMRQTHMTDVRSQLPRPKIGFNDHNLPDSRIPWNGIRQGRTLQLEGWIGLDSVFSFTLDFVLLMPTSRERSQGTCLWDSLL